MQIPTRRAQLLKKRDDQGPMYLTKGGIERLKRELIKLRAEHPEAADEVYRLAQLGDFSENAEYQEAKWRLRRLNDRIESVKERLKRAVEIDNGPDARGRAQIGSTVVIRTDRTDRTYQIVGPNETSPARGRISYLSPLGSALLNRAAGDKVAVQTESGKMEYEVKEVR